MTELKTLKDIEDENYYHESSYALGGYQLRQEAIKWIKEIDGLGREGYVDEVCINPCGEYSCSAIIGFIKHFFNITDEDLK